jgi:transaldolase
MNRTRQLHDLGQSLWLDNISRELLDSGKLAGYVRDDSVTGVTSNPTIFEKAIVDSDRYDTDIRTLAGQGLTAEQIFFHLAIDDLRRAADLLEPTFTATGGVDGWVSLEVSPLLAHDAAATVRAAIDLHARAARPNLFIKIPGTAQGTEAIEETIFRGVPVNVTLLFSREHYRACADAYCRGLERRLGAGQDPRVNSVASLFVSRWDVAANQSLPQDLRNRLGMAVAAHTYAGYRDLLASPRWQRLAEAGARPQRLLWASTGTKDPAVADTMYVEQLAAADTINTMPEKTLLGFADHGGALQPLAPDGGGAPAVLAACTQAGLDLERMASKLQEDGAQSFVASWRALLEGIDRKAGMLGRSIP